MVNFTDIRAANQRIQKYVHRTPLLSSSSLNADTGARLVFKCENFQRTGAFKARGAFNAVFSLEDQQAARGVVTSSSGNQAAALALAGRTRGIPVYVAMPKIALQSKVAAVRRYGGEITWVEGAGKVPTAEEYDTAVAAIQAKTEANAVHPYNDPRTIAGQGTCALEFVEDQPILEMVLAPVGGGGLLAGTCVAVKELDPKIKVIGCEPEMADDAQRSLRSGRIVTQSQPQTIADGLRTSLGDLTFPIIQHYCDDVVTVSEAAIVSAMRLAWEILKVIIEPSSAVALAAVLEAKVEVSGRCVGIILSGGNVDVDRLPWISEHRADLTPE